MVPEGGNRREGSNVGGTVSHISEADPEEDLVFGRFVGGGSRVVPVYGCVLEKQIVGGGDEEDD